MRTSPLAALVLAMLAAAPAAARAQLAREEHRLMEVHSLLLDLPPVQAPAALSPGTLDASLAAAKERWARLLASHRVETPDATFDAFLNDWVRYQAISARIQGRCGYYQQSGAYGFRDQLQDSQVWLAIDPARCREQLRLHAAHQFVDGSVYHWWHPLTEQGHVTKMTDDLLWLAFVTASYLRETGDFSVLDDAAPYLDDPEPRPLADHVARAFARARM